MRAERLLANDEGIARAAFLLRAGRLVAFATETVYGLGADATNAEAVTALFAAKNRPRFNPLICHYPSAQAAFADSMAGELARRLAERFWPGPLTLVLPRREATRVVSMVSANLPTIAVRVPQSPAARALLEAVAVPIAAPSANPSGRVSPTTAQHVFAELDQHIAAVLDAGPATIGVESTVLELTGPKPLLLRPGGVPSEALAAITGPLEAAPPGRALSGPGMLASHYAPRLSLRLDAKAVSKDEALLAFGSPLPGAGVTFNLSAERDLAEAAARLFAGLRLLDDQGSRLGLVRIAVMPVPRDGLGQAIADRLARAAAPRIFEPKEERGSSASCIAHA